MVVVGLTGGIGSGKSTVGQLLVARGAAVVDADVLAREAVAPGTPGLAAVVSRFGPGVLAADGSLDRRTMADVVFSDRVALDDLNAIVHPPVRAAIEARLAALDEAGSDGVVVLEIPLLVESGRSYGASMIVVVDCPEDVAVRRLVAGRGMEEADVRRRIAAQASRADRLAAADLVIDNGGSPQQLAAEVDRVWGLLDNPGTIGLS
jgi:dephospho-CoA kinase